MPQTDPSIARYFADLPDPRVDRTRKHPLGDILVIALCATLAGADSWEEVEAFGEAKEDWLKTFLDLPNGIPSHDTFYRVFARLDPKRLAECVARWMGAACEAAGLRHVAVWHGRRPCSTSGKGGSPVLLKGDSKAAALAAHGDGDGKGSSGDFQQRITFTVQRHAAEPVCSITLILLAEHDTDQESGGALVTVDSLDLTFDGGATGQYRR